LQKQYVYINFSELQIRMGRISNLDLVKELMKDGRKPYWKIAEKLDLTTESAVRKRVKKQL